LFNFDVHDDVRLLSDASREKDESHAGKVVERAWYNRFKHVRSTSLVVRLSHYDRGSERIVCRADEFAGVR
jgi:hypothetical protein